MVSKSYEDLVVWQRAVDLAPKVYELLRSFPKHETYALADQIRRAVVSISANIAEGQARRSKKEFLQHLSIARGSLAELHTLLVVAQRLSYLTAPQIQEITEELAMVGKPLAGLMSHLKTE